jgi:hypothetical protein
MPFFYTSITLTLVLYLAFFTWGGIMSLGDKIFSTDEEVGSWIVWFSIAFLGTSMLAWLVYPYVYHVVQQFDDRFFLLYWGISMSLMAGAALMSYCYRKREDRSFPATAWLAGVVTAPYVMPVWLWVRLGMTRSISTEEKPAAST